MLMRFLRPRSRAGQVVIPALFLFPTFFLFIYLIYETAKLSREKIRHQFALDAAVFVEMTNYSDFLNRTAYVNGAFPMRIFSEGFSGTTIECDQKDVCDNPPDCTQKHSCTGGRGETLWKIMCMDGDFPVKHGNCSGDPSISGQQYAQTDMQWDISFGDKWYNSRGADKNASPPSWPQPVSTCKGTNSGAQTPCLNLLTMADANSYWINWDDANQIFKLYVQIYQLLGSVEDAQYSVLQRLAAQHNFLTKSYWLNTGDFATDGVQSFASGIGNWSPGTNIQYSCYEYLNFYGNQPTGNKFQPWQVFAPDTPWKVPSPNYCSGLFQLLWVSPKLLEPLKRLNPSPNNIPEVRGVAVRQSWKAPANYFNYDFNAPAQPKVNVTAAIDGFAGALPAIWPNPTPKFQVRTYP